MTDSPAPHLRPAITARIDIDADLVRQGFRRCRLHHPRRALLTALKVLVVLAFAALGILALQRGYSLTGVFAILLGLSLFFAHHIDEWMVVRAFSKSPLFGDQVELGFDTEGLRARSPKIDARHQWSAFTRYVRCPDGFLLLQGPKSFIWIPQERLTDPAQSDSLHLLLQTHVPT